MKKSTKELIEILLEHPGDTIEASMSNGFLRATHMFEWDGVGIIDVGIDSQEVKWSIEEFLTLYQHALWLVSFV